MDVYLPADFHALHDDVVTDWRDASRDSGDVAPASANAVQHAERDVDPNWLAI